VLENVSKVKTADAIRSLPQLRAKFGILVQLHAETGDIAREEKLSVDLIEIGDVFKVLPDSKIPCDGIVVRGASSVNESFLTGESLPISKQVGDTVIGASTNQHGVLLVRATSIGSETTLAQIVRLVNDAQQSRAPIQRYADKISTYFVPSVFVIAVLTFITWMILLNRRVVRIKDNASVHASASHNGNLVFALETAITVLVIACPCALGLATPTAVMVGSAVGVQNGILIKSGGALEIIHNVTAVVFDKTGTLTRGELRVTDSVLLKVRSPQRLPTDSADVNEKKRQSLPAEFSNQQFFHIACSAEQLSSHPVAKAIAAYSMQFGPAFASQLSEPTEFASIHGQGLSCRVDGASVLIGNRMLMQSNGLALTQHTDDAMALLEQQGKTVVIVAVSERIVGIIAVADTIKPEAQVLIEHLSRLHIEPCLLSGDNQRATHAIGTIV
jgi:Cu+-exporting ATPase